MDQTRPLTFGERLKLARKAKRMTQKALGTKVGMSQATISELENGEYTSSSYTAQLAHELDVTGLWLAEGRGPMRSDSGYVIDGAISEVKQSVSEPPAAYGPSVTNEEAEVLRNLRILLPERRAKFIQAIAQAAEEKRKVESEVLKQYGIAVTDERVAKHFGPAPKVDLPVERRRYLIVPRFAVESSDGERVDQDGSSGSKESP